MCWYSSMTRSALGSPALSTRAYVQKPPRRYPSCAIHGQTVPGGASIVIARLALNCALATTSSPRIVAATSASVALQRMCHGRSNGEPAQIGTAESVSKIKGASSRVSPSGHLLEHPRETTMIVRMYVNRAGGPARAGRPPGQGFANVARLPGIALSSRLHLQPGSTRLATAVRDSASA